MEACIPDLPGEVYGVDRPEDLVPFPSFEGRLHVRIAVKEGNPPEAIQDVLEGRAVFKDGAEKSFEVSFDGGRTWRKNKPGSSLRDVGEFAEEHDLELKAIKRLGYYHMAGGFAGRWYMVVYRKTEPKWAVEVGRRGSKDHRVIEEGLGWLAACALAEAHKDDRAVVRMMA